MKKYLGVKIVDAEPCESWAESGGHPIGTGGYKVRYKDNYTSWSPKDIFKEAYRPITNLTFGLAIEALKMGRKVQRKGWNGKDMFIYLQEGTQNLQEARNPILNDVIQANGNVNLNAHIDMKTADGSITIGWLASQTDILAEDWHIIQ